MQIVRPLLFSLAVIAGNANSLASAAETDLRTVELSLLHRRLDLGGVRALDAKTGRWSPLRVEGARLLVVHLWAVECSPCTAEMPLLKNIARGWKNEPGVQIVFVSETLDEKVLRDFWFKTNRDRVPETPLTQSIDNRIRDTLDTGKQPLTLLLDQDLVVRQALVGSLTERSPELTTSMSRLLRALNGRR